MDLSETQKAQVATWIGEGLGLSDVQKRLDDEFDVSMTFMEVRFLVDDLELDLKDAAPKAEADITKQPPPAPSADAPTPPPGAEGPAAAGNVSVSVDPIQRPGALVSGSVIFSDGEKMEWQLDQTGRLGLIPGKEDYRPSESDIAEFQTALQGELQKKGFQ